MKKSLFTVFGIIIATALSAQTPNYQWAKNLGGYYGYSTGRSVAVDASGNVYTSGTFEGRVDFDPGPATVYLTALGTLDGFVTKTDPAGNLVWVRQFGSNADGNSIAVAGSGNICIVGGFSGTADFNPGSATYNLTSAGFSDIFILMLNSSGNFVWARQLGGINNDYASSLTVDSSGNLYTIGRFQNVVDFDPGPANFTLNNSGIPAVFILKLDGSGNFVFAKHLSGGFSKSNTITLDVSGNIYAAGIFNSTVDFDPGAGVYNISATGNQNVFILKLNNAGGFTWVRKLEGASINADAIKTDVSENVYVGGTFQNIVDFDPGPGTFNLTSAGNDDIYMAKFNPVGNYIWARSIGSSNANEEISSMVLDGAGNICAAGSFNGTVDFDPGPGTFNISGTLYGVYAFKWSAAGNFIMAKGISSNEYTLTNSIAVHSSGDIYLTGQFHGVCDFDPGAAVVNRTAQVGNFFYLLKLDPSGFFNWVYTAGAGSSTVITAMTTDSYGNVYTAGDLLGTADFDPGPGVFNLSTGPGDNSGDVFVAKYNSAGSLLWAKRLGGTSHDYVMSITVDPSGNVYTAGSFKGTADFNPGAATFNLTSSSSNYDVFVSKLNASGNFVWAKRLGNTATENIYSIALDVTGNLFVAGFIYPGTNSYEFYLNKLDPSGNLLWSKTYGGSYIDLFHAVKTDVAGNIYLAGYFSNTCDFDPGPGVFDMTAGGYQDGFICKLDGAGNFVWAKSFTGSGVAGYTKNLFIELDNAGNIYTSGIFDQTTDFDPGSGVINLTTSDLYDVFIVKTDNAGNLIWAKQFAGTHHDVIEAMAVDNQGNVYSTGTFQSADFDPGPGTSTLTATGGSDMFISKLDSSGNFKWVQQIGNELNDPAAEIAVDGSGAVYTAGTFRRTVDFDPGTGVVNLTANGYPDSFIHKLSQCLAPQAIITPAGPTTFCTGSSVTLNANTGPGLTYQWMKNGTPIPGAVSPVYVATVAGNYYAVVSNSTPCSETSNTIKVNVPCIPVDPSGQRTDYRNNLVSESMQVYPNPSQGEFQIISPPGQLQVFNAFGQLVYSATLSGDNGAVDLSGFPGGVYLFKLKAEGSFLHHKVVLSR